MTMKTENDSPNFTPVIDSAFEILGTASKNRLFQYLNAEYDIDIRVATQAHVNGIHRAIEELFGRDAAELLMKQVYLEMDRIDNAHD